ATKAVLDARNDQLKTCYDGVLKSQPNAAGTVVARFTVSRETGKVSNARVDAAKSTAPETVRQCVADALQGLELKPADKLDGDAVLPTKLGASNFFEKPLNRDRLLVSVKNVLEAAKHRRAVEQASYEQLQRYEMIGQSTPMQRLFHEIEKVAPTKASVLITG